jgi:transcription elongation factor GreA
MVSIRFFWILYSGFYILLGPMKAGLLKRFEDELQALNRELKMELPQEIKRARELGDLRENAEYQAAKERQRLVEARISMLQKRISEVAMMNLDRIPHGKVGFGSTVHLRDADGRARVYQIVLSEEADAEKGWISIGSPIGRSLLNKDEGDEVKVVTPNGTRTFEITKLSTIHDDGE